MQIHRQLKAVTRTLICGTAVLTFYMFAVLTSSAFEPSEESGFGSNPGNLRMFSYAPAGLKTPASLIVVLHGCKQKATTFGRDAGWFDLAESAGVMLLLPEQKGLNPYWYDNPWIAPWARLFGSNNQNACFNWFQPGNNRRDRGEALSIAQMIDAMLSKYKLDRSRVYIAGLSAGGAMTAAMLAAYPERFSGGAIVAGVPVGCADSVARAFRCMENGVDRTPEQWRKELEGSSASTMAYPPVSIWHGDADERVVLRNQIELVEQWTAAHRITGTAPQRTSNDDGVTREIYTDTVGTPKVESVVVRNLGHTFPIRVDGVRPCGQPGDFVSNSKVCAVRAIARFWGLVSVVR